MTYRQKQTDFSSLFYTRQTNRLMDGQTVDVKQFDLLGKAEKRTIIKINIEEIIDRDKERQKGKSIKRYYLL